MMTEFEAPVPGESLTTSPKGMPYERPPEIVDPEEAIQMHLTRLTEPDKMEAILDSLEMGIDVKSLTKGYLRSAVANGIHTVDVSLLIAPVIHEFIKETANEAGIDYEEGMVNETKEETRRNQIEFQKAKRKLEKEGYTSKAQEKEISIPVDSEELPRHSVAEDQPRTKGLMKRRGEV